MRIIHLVLGKANPDRMNGVNKLVYEMVSTQQRLGFDVQLWGITKETTHNYPERNFKTALFPMLANKLRVDKTLVQAIKKLPKVTTIHMHGSFIPEFYHIGKLLQKRNIPYVYTPHGALAPAALQRSAWKKNIYFRFFEKHLLANAAAMIATGKSVFDNVDTLLRLRRKVLIPNGQPLIERRTHMLSKDVMIFGFCGRIALEHKGLDLLLQGYQIFKAQGGKAMLHLIGDGAEMPKFKQLAEDLDVLKYLTLYGAKFGVEKFQLLSSFDVFVHTSRMEGFPAAVLEATATGLPVLISRHTNVWDYIDRFKCGLLIDPNTPKEIAKQMQAFEALYEAGKVEEMGQQGKRMIQKLFDWKVICHQLREEYQLATKQYNLTTPNLIPI